LQLQENNQQFRMVYNPNKPIEQLAVQTTWASHGPCQWRRTTIQRSPNTQQCLQAHYWHTRLPRPVLRMAKRRRTRKPGLDSKVSLPKRHKIFERNKESADPANATPTTHIKMPNCMIVDSLNVSLWCCWCGTNFCFGR
jgi:hypothetical protein